MEVMKMDKDYYATLFKDYPDVVKVYQLKEMLPKMGKNKIYALLKDNKIHSKRIGRDYLISNISLTTFKL